MDNDDDGMCDVQYWLLHQGNPLAVLVSPGAVRLDGHGLCLGALHFSSHLPRVFETLARVPFTPHALRMRPLHDPLHPTGTAQLDAPPNASPKMHLLMQMPYTGCPSLLMHCARGYCMTPASHKHNKAQCPSGRCHICCY